MNIIFRFTGIKRKEEHNDKDNKDKLSIEAKKFTNKERDEQTKIHLDKQKNTLKIMQTGMKIIRKPTL